MAEGSWVRASHPASSGLASWAKLTMALQSIISLIVVGLVTARAVNVFS